MSHWITQSILPKATANRRDSIKPLYPMNRYWNQLQALFVLISRIPCNQELLSPNNRPQGLPRALIF